MLLKTCKTCKGEFPATTEYFHIHKLYKDGLNSECKKCRSEKARKRRVKESNKEGYKFCLDCGRELHLSKFNTYIKSADGYFDVCVECQILRRHKDCKDDHKKCKVCNREFPITRDFFMPDDRSLDGYRYICLECLGRRFYPDVQDEKWSDIDKQIIIDNYYTRTINEIIPMLSAERTYKSVLHMAGKLGLKKVDNYEPIEESERYSIIDNNVYKLCKCCRRYLPLELKYFPRDIDCKDGYRNLCKECKGENFEVFDGHEWTDKEIEIIVTKYDIMTNKELQDNYFPHLTIKQINDKGSLLRIKKTKETSLRALREGQNEEWRNKISKTHKLNGYYKGENNPMYGSKRVGELNPNWKGGKRTEKEIAMASDEYKVWRYQVFKRDNYTCQCCGEMTHDIEAHHLDNFADFPELRLEVDNGITLCKDCHNPNRKGSFHNIYGTIHNTKEQFEVYLKEYKKYRSEEVS